MIDDDVDVVDERDLQRKVARCAASLDVLHYHTHDSRRSESGFPDSVFVGRGLKIRELKMTPRSPVSAEQKIWLARLDAAGVDAGIWYAEDYRQQVVHRELEQLQPRDTAPGSPDRRPMVNRVAKRLYLDRAGANTAKADLLWEAGVAPHEQWLSQAQHTLTLIADELPRGLAEHRAWLTDHDLHVHDGLAALLAAITADLTAHPTPLG